MTTDIAITFGVVAAVVALFAWNRVPVPIVALGSALVLYATGILGAEEALAGLGDPAVILIASLFVVGAGLDATGVTAWVGRLLIAQAGSSRSRLLVLVMLLVAGLSALISVNGAVAAMLPMVVILAVRLDRAPSKLLMPMVFAAHAGSLLALTGSPVNVLIANAAASSGGIGFFEFALVGVPLVLGTGAIVLGFGEKLLPDRPGGALPPDLSRHALTLVEEYALADGVFRLRVRPGSALIGQRAPGTELVGYPDLAVVEVLREGVSVVEGTPVASGDHLVVRGGRDAAAELARQQGLAFRADPEGADLAEALLTRTSGLGEVVIPPRSALVGSEVYPGMVTPSGDLVVLGVRRKDEERRERTVLAPGDTVLVHGTWRALDEHLAEPDVLLVDSPDLLRRQAVALGAGAKRAVAVLVLMVLAMATGAVPSVIAGLSAACLLVLLGVLTVSEAWRAVNWTTVVLVGAMMPLSTAISSTGAASLVANQLVAAVRDFGPYGLLAGLFLLTAVLGQVISNTATALIVIPIGVAAAGDLGVSPLPVLMCVCVAAAAAFLTPVATPVNLMIVGPGGYRFGDYWKLGLPLLLWFFVVAIGLVPLLWPFAG